MKKSFEKYKHLIISQQLKEHRSFYARARLIIIYN